MIDASPLERAMNPNNHVIDQEVFYDAWKACRYHLGMGDLNLRWNPYKCNWSASISFSLITGAVCYVAESDVATEALREVARQVETYYPEEVPR